MILVFVTNECFGEVADLSFDGKVSYRNPRYLRDHDKPEKCDKVYVHGNWPKVEALYKDKLIQPDKKRMDSSQDYTIAELREMKPDIENWKQFTEGDTRKSIDSL